MRPGFLSALLVAGAAVLDALAGNVLSVHGVKPSFAVIAVYAFSITAGETSGIFYGALGGLMVDCLSGGYPGLFMSEYAIIGYFAGKAGRKWFNVGESANFGGIFGLSALGALYAAALIGTLSGTAGTLWLMMRFGLPGALYNAVVGACLLWLFKKQLARRVPWLRYIQVRL